MRLVNQPLTPALTILLTVLAVTSFLPELTAQESRPSVLVTSSGKTYLGEITKSDFGYVVQSGGQRLIVDASEVICHSESLQHAYEKMASQNETQAREQNLLITPDSRHQLALWCFRNGLYEACQQELAAALRVDRHHPACLELARKIQPDLKADQNQPSISDSLKFKTEEELNKQLLLISATPNPASTIGELPTGLANCFTQEIQPIVAFHCGKGGCHDPNSKRSFTFSHLPNRPGVYRSRLENNLDQLLQAMRRSSSPESFQAFCDSNHPSHPNPDFEGPTGQKHRQSFQNWVVTCWKYKQFPQSRSIADQTLKKASAVKLTNFEQSSSDDAVDNTLNANSLIQQELQAHQYDAFDPMRFNLKK